MSYEDAEEALERIEWKIDQLRKEVHEMAVDQQTFDTELAGLVQAITDLGTALDAFIASKPAGVDLTAEEASVQSAAAAVKAELGKITPAPVVPPVVPPVPPPA